MYSPKKIICMIPFLLWRHLVCGQAYLPYYHLCHDADKEMYLENYELALTKFEQAFELVDYVHTTSYEKASQCAIALGDFQQGYQWAQKALLNGSHNRFWKARKFKAFRQSTYGQWLRDSIPYFQRQAVEKVDTVYLKQIDSLYFVDQYIISGSMAAKGNYAIDKSALPENRFELDSTNLIALIHLIEAYGFPSEQLLGVDGYQKATMIIHHNFRLEQNEKYHPIVLKALFEGEYLPSDFEGMYEQYCMWYKDTTFFSTFDQDLSESNLERINLNRRKYGLKDLSAFQIKRKGLVMKAKW